MKLLLIAAYLISLHQVLCFTFASLTVNADTKVINTVTTYQIDFDRTQDDAIQPTAYITKLITPSDTVTVTFPSPFILTSVTCIISINSGNQFSPTCSVLGNSVVISNIISTNTVVSRISVWISNIMNPSPAIVTDYFTGTIGTDTSGSGYFASNVILQPAIFTSCYSTFNPTTVNSTSSMIITLQPKNQIQSNGYVVIKFPATRRWTNDISTVNFMPISTSMSCSNRSTNVISSIQCVGDINQVTVTASTMFSTTVTTSFSFSINNFLSPPTNQQSDLLIATSYSSSGYKIDTCNFYVSDLTPKTLNIVTISTSTGGLMTVNLFYTIRVTFTLTDTLAQTDTLTVVFPTGSVVNFNSATVTTNFSNAVASSSFQSSSSTLYVSLTNQNRIFSIGTVLILTVGSYQAPPSIQATQNFVLSIYRNNFKKLQGVAQVTALSSTLTGTVSSIASTTVNANTTYTFQITTIDPISSSGRIKIVIPSTIAILTTSASCATLSGTGTSTTPTCSFNSTQNSITLSSLNSSAAIIAAQTLTLSISGLRNPPSISPTTNFAISTFYRSADTSLVATGTIAGITATSAILTNTQISVTPSTLIVNDISTTYSLQYRVSQPIPTGGYFIIFIPSDIGIDLASLPNSCSVNLNNTSFTSTPCSGASVSGGVNINFTNPLAVDATINTIILARISSIFTNPSSTRPTSSFRLHTYHSNGFQIAYITNAITVQMTTPANFNSIAISRASNRNNQLTTYTFTINQKSIFQSASIILITFPSNVVPSSSSVCALSAPSTATVSCSYSASIMKIVLPSSAIASAISVTITITNIRNPPSFQPAGIFKLQSKTANQLYTYSLQTYSSGLTNTIATQFPAITYQFTPAAYAQPVSLQINFTLTNSRLPTKMRLTLANSFVIGTLSCNSFIDFTGSCSIISANTIQVTGTFNNAPMAFSVTGLTSPAVAPVDYSSLVSFDSGGYKIDQSTSAIRFSVLCTMPCRTCQSASQPTVCTSCYSQTSITNMIYFDSILKNCYSTCPSGKYADTTTNTCTPCDTNCLTCNNSPTFCLSCNSSSSFIYLFVNTTAIPNTQTCVAACPNQMYPDSTNSFICTACVSPCVTCTSSTACLSCISGRYLIGNTCGTTCPSSIYISNPTTNRCDACDITCSTCSVITTNCTSCNSSYVLYQNQCRVSCPTPLVPQNGTCGPCDNTCLTCINDPFTCTSCDSGSSLPYLLNNRCLNTCPELYYNNVGLGICSLCSSVSGLNCNNCSSVSTCRTCNVGFVLFNNTCLNYVPSGYVNISGVAQACTGDCLNCSVSTTNCTSCKNYNLLNNICYQTCPSGYIGISKICQPCTSPCSTCLTTTTTCTSCLATLTPKVYLSNSVCIEICPDSTYASNANYSCVSCVSPCQYCSSAAVCLSCLNGYFLYNSSCITSCPSGFAGVNRICAACQGNCATCLNQTTICTSCKSNTYLFQLNNSCVSSCGNGLFVDAVSQTCVYCIAPCKTCQNTPTTCLSCLTGALYNSQCLSACPNQYFNQTGICQQCPDSCSFCTSLTSCSTCAINFVQYNGFCVSSCPATHAVVLNRVCTACTGSNCHQCTSTDVCTMCDNQFSLLNGACLSSCPSGYQTNGTHCNDLTVQTLTTSASFPVPFSIAAAVLIIACLMSKLQFTKTFLPGAIFAFIGLLQTGALIFFVYLYFTNFFVAQPLPFYVGIAALAYLIVLNIFAFIIQNLIFCFDKQFKIWYAHSPNKCSTFWVNFLSLTFSHKFRNILFCKLFTFAVFTSQLQSVNKFKVINVFSFLSLIHSGAAIFAASVAIGFTQISTQIYYQCIDVIIVTALNAVLAFFNVMKPYDFFYEMTPEGFQLKKKINAQEIYCQSHNKILPAGRQIESQQGYRSNIFHNQVNLSKEGLNTALMTTKTYKEGTFKPYDISELSDESFGSLVHPQKLLFQDASMQALERIDDGSIQQTKQQIIQQIKQTDQEKLQKDPRPFDYSAIPPPGHQNQQDNSNFTIIFKYSDKGVGNTIDQVSSKGIQNTIDHGPQIQDRSIQQSYAKKVDQSAQRYSTFDPVDRSIQKTVFFREDQSIQYSQTMIQKPKSLHGRSLHDKSVHDKSLHDKSVSNMKVSVHDQSVSNMGRISAHDKSVSNIGKISAHDKSVSNIGRVSAHDKSTSNIKASVKDKSIQQIKSVSNKSLMFQPSLRDQQAQKSTIEKIDEQIQMIPENDVKQIQAVQNQSQKGNQKDVSVEQKSIQFIQSLKDKSVQHQNQNQNQNQDQNKNKNKNQNVIQFDQFAEQMSPSKKSQHVVFQQEYFQDESPRNMQLKQQQKDQFLLPKQQIKSYEEELQQRIRLKEEELNKIKRIIQKQQKKNQQKAIKKPKFYDQTNKIVQKQQRNSTDNPALSIQQQKIHINQQQALKKQPKHVEQEENAQINKTLEQIQVIDDEGNEKKIKVQFQEQQNSKVTQQQFLGMLQQHPNKVIFENSSEVNEQQTQNNFVRSNRDQLAQQHSHNSQQIRNFMLDESEGGKSSKNNLIFNKKNKKGGVQFLQSQAQISQGKDSSTKIYSQIRPINANRRVTSVKNRNYDNFQSSEQQPSFDPIVIKPIDPYKPHSYSDMSQTIEQMHPHMNQTYQSTHLNNQQIKNKLRQSIKQSMPNMSRLKKQIPIDRQQQSLVRRKFQSNSNAVMTKPDKIQIKPDQQRIRRSSLLLVGKSQFNTEEGLARKKIGNASPLKTAKRWQYQNEDKNIQESGGEQQIKNTRVAQTHLINPLQTDKSALQFKISRVGQEDFRRQNRREKNLITDQISPFIGQFSNSESPSKPRFDRRDFSEEYVSEQVQQAQPYIQQDSDYASKYKNQMILGQMLNRPGNRQLEQHYKKNKSKTRQKQKKNNQANEFLSETQRIYSQKIDQYRKK